MVSFLRFVGVTELIMLTSMSVGLFLATLSPNPVVGFYLCTSQERRERRVVETTRGSGWLLCVG